jgi:uncharacterized protein YdaU (DUF1376 family)
VADLYYFPLMAGDWLAGEAVSMMTPEQEGGFFHLLCHQWLSKALPCSLPNDDAALAQLSRLGADRWAVIGGFIRAQFDEVKDEPTRIRNPKLWSIWKEFQAKHRKRVTAGKAGGDAKAKRQQSRSNARELVGDSSSNGTALLKQSSTNQNHNQNQSKKKLKTTTTAPEQTSPFPKSVCDPLYEAWISKRGAIEYSAFRKALAPLFPASGPRFAQDALVGAIDAHAEYASILSPKEARFENVYSFAANIDRWIKLGSMPAQLGDGTLTERGRLIMEGVL